MAYDHAPINSNYEVKPWFNSKRKTLVPKYLEAKCAVVRTLSWRIRIQTRDKTIESVEHSFKSSVVSGANWDFSEVGIE